MGGKPQETFGTCASLAFFCPSRLSPPLGHNVDPGPEAVFQGINPDAARHTFLGASGTCASALSASGQTLRAAATARRAPPGLV